MNRRSLCRSIVNLHGIFLSNASTIRTENMVNSKLGFP
jgi:hypothetical protein